MGFVKSVTPKEKPDRRHRKWFAVVPRTVPLGVLCLVLVVILNIIFV